jgi:hypothetical protein
MNFYRYVRKPPLNAGVTLDYPNRTNQKLYSFPARKIGIRPAGVALRYRLSSGSKKRDQTLHGGERLIEADQLGGGGERNLSHIVPVFGGPERIGA